MQQRIRLSDSPSATQTISRLYIYYGAGNTNWIQPDSPTFSKRGQPYCIDCLCTSVTLRRLTADKNLKSSIFWVFTQPKVVWYRPLNMGQIVPKRRYQTTSRWVRTQKTQDFISTAAEDQGQAVKNLPVQKFSQNVHSV